MNEKIKLVKNGKLEKLTFGTGKTLFGNYL